MPRFFHHVSAAALILDTKSNVSLPGIMCAEFKRCKFYVEFIHINMDVFSTVVLWNESSPCVSFILLRWLWKLRPATLGFQTVPSSPRQVLLKVSLRKKKKYQSAAKLLFAIRSLKYFTQLSP